VILGLTFLSPFAALVALLGVVPLAALVGTSARARGIRSRLGLTGPQSSLLGLGLAVAAVAALLGLAAAQPVVGQTHKQEVRADAEIVILLDISRSMLASVGPSGRTRLERAKLEALRLREEFPDVPVGVSSFTDRTLPHLFPVADEQLFRATVDQAVDIERPPPIALLRTGVTTLAALSAIATRGYFSPHAQNRVLVAFTDGETRPFDPESVGAVLRRGRGIRAFFVHVWNERERVYTNGRPEADYRPDPASREQLDRLATAVRGSSFGENEVSAVASAVRSALGTGPTVSEIESRTQLSLGPYLVLAAVFPVGFLLVRLAR
jgi:von Willebrand factor type A domain